MNEITCPACAGPDNAECATCNGTSSVTQEAYETFITERDRQIATWQLKQALQELPVEAVPGIEQTAIVISAVDNTITADVDSVQLTWDETTNSWV